MSEERTPVSATRRALMLGAASVSVAVAAPTIAQTTANPDAHLLALDQESAAIQGPLDEAEQAEQSAYRALDALAPPRTAILTFTANDAGMFGFSRHVGHPFGWDVLEHLPKYRAAALAQPRLIHARQLARIDEVLGAQQAWEAYKLQPDYLAAKAEAERQGQIVDRLGERQSAIWAEMLTIRAYTPAGLAAKARICPLPDEREAELWPITVYRSIRSDLLAMEG